MIGAVVLGGAKLKGLTIVKIDQRRELPDEEIASIGLGVGLGR